MSSVLLNNLTEGDDWADKPMTYSSTVLINVTNKYLDKAMQYCIKHAAAATAADKKAAEEELKKWDEEYINVSTEDLFHILMVITNPETSFLSFFHIFVRVFFLYYYYYKKIFFILFFLKKKNLHLGFFLFLGVFFFKCWEFFFKKKYVDFLRLYISSDLLLFFLLIRLLFFI
ncbi:hypothetical protein QJS04_geneDACA011064 [Acorus gramineus]|uniref:SKP1 component dimerisation domain-containing protein n=1 Tax=Acorus gramineus TaxID=55184 RepID=A0AAV9BKC0_ACOGR|nr:hypothetical protein QJS04_geneDACA011064 [Acorus gramineus]